MSKYLKHVKLGLNQNGRTIRLTEFIVRSKGTMYVTNDPRRALKKVRSLKGDVSVEYGKHIMNSKEFEDFADMILSYKYAQRVLGRGHI